MHKNVYTFENYFCLQFLQISPVGKQLKNVLNQSPFNFIQNFVRGNASQINKKIPQCW